MILALCASDRSSSNPAANVRMGVPGGDWSRAELDARARWENEQIKPRQRNATHYWFLGKVLLALGRDFDAAQWKAWRETHTIDRTRCERALLIARAFSSAGEVADLPVLTAVALAGKLLGRPPRQNAADARLRRWAKAIEASLQTRLDEIPDLTDAGRAVARITELHRRLASLSAALEKRRSTITNRRPKRAK